MSRIYPWTFIISYFFCSFRTCSHLKSIWSNFDNKYLNLLILTFLNTKSMKLPIWKWLTWAWSFANSVWWCVNKHLHEWSHLNIQSNPDAVEAGKYISSVNHVFLYSSLPAVRYSISQKSYQASLNVQFADLLIIFYCYYSDVLPYISVPIWFWLFLRWYLLVTSLMFLIILLFPSKLQSIMLGDITFLWIQ